MSVELAAYAKMPKVYGNLPMTSQLERMFVRKHFVLKVVYEKVFEIAFIKILDCYRLADEESGDALLQSLNIEKPVNLEFAMVFDKMFKLLQLGIPDEEFESLMNHIKTTEVNK